MLQESALQNFERDDCGGDNNDAPPRALQFSRVQRMQHREEGGGVEGQGPDRIHQ